jgi:hypothetical protein
MYPLGHTVHSAFKLPTDDTTLATLLTLFGPSDRRAALLRAAKLIIIDEAMMLPKEYLDLIDLTMQDIENRSDSTFGGQCVFVLSVISYKSSQSFETGLAQINAPVVSGTLQCGVPGSGPLHRHEHASNT